MMVALQNSASGIKEMTETALTTWLLYSQLSHIMLYLRSLFHSKSYEANSPAETLKENYLLYMLG